VIAAVVHYHVVLGWHVAVDALCAGAAGPMLVMRGDVELFRQMAQGAQGVDGPTGAVGGGSNDRRTDIRASRPDFVPAATGTTLRQATEGMAQKSQVCRSTIGALSGPLEANG
jgi:hypothetical protein